MKLGKYTNEVLLTRSAFTVPQKRAKIETPTIKIGATEDVKYVSDSAAVDIKL